MRVQIEKEGWCPIKIEDVYMLSSRNMLRLIAACNLNKCLFLSHHVEYKDGQTSLVVVLKTALIGASGLVRIVYTPTSAAERELFAEGSFCETPNQYGPTIAVIRTVTDLAGATPIYRDYSPIQV